MTSFYLTKKNIKGSRPIAINTETKEVVRLMEGVQEKPVISEPFDHLKMKRKINGVNMKLLKDSFILRQKPEDEYLSNIYETRRSELDDKMNKVINTYEGSFLVLPTPKKSDRIFLAGACGSGKTFYMSKYIASYKEIYPDKKIYLFSDVDADDLLDKHKVIRVKLDEKLVTDPIQTSELQDSMVIIDDVDSISNKKIKNAVISLYDSILKKGSTHNNITLLITSHQSSDGLATRNILLNCNYLVFFPQCAVGLRYTLQKLGLSKEQLNKLMNVPSRAVVLHKNYPFFIVSDKSVELL